jgi:predicted TIM-barrel fold metal-dependent hydrolase
MPADHFVDTHLHVACGDVGRYPRRPTGVGSSWWSEPEGEADAVLDAARSAGAAVVVVQAVGAYGFDCACALDTVAFRPGFASLVAAPDMSTNDPVATLATVIDSPLLTGVRLFGIGDGAPWLDDGRIDAVMELCAERELVAVPTVFTDRLTSLRGAIDRHPDVAVALDHCAFPDMAGQAGEDALFEMADVASMRLKVSTHVLAAWRGEGRLVPMLERLVAAFGADRLCWGSDHPQHQGLTYAEKLDLALDATASLSDDDRAKFFSGTAKGLGWG